MIRISRTRRTVRSAAAEFGPPPGALYPELADYSTTELLSRPTAEILAEIEVARGVRSAIHRLNTEDAPADRPKEVAR